MIVDPQTSILLKKLVDSVTFDERIRRACLHVIDKPDFYLWTGSVNRKHHATPGGLAAHTLQVASFADDMAKTGKLDREVVLCGAIYHDIGKMQAYSMEESIPFPFWRKNPLYSQIGHLTLSYSEWISVAKTIGFDSNFTNAVSHCILAHHGEKDRGSPVVPCSPEAWAVHLADMASCYCCGGKV